jgi:signal transduction histidine kinase/CheY-like chemotaxis protein
LSATETLTAATQLPRPPGPFRRRPRWLTPFRRYALGALSSAVALQLTLALRPWSDEAPFALFFLAVALAAAFGGLGPGLLATALATLSTIWYLTPPPGSLLLDQGGLVRVILFVSAAGLIAWLVERSRRAEASLRWNTAAQRFLAEASGTLSSSLDYERTLGALTRLAVPHFADWCAVDVLGEDGDLKRLAVAHVDPGKVDLAHELHQRYPSDPQAAQGVFRVIRTGESELYRDIPDTLLVAVARDDEHLRILRDLGLRSAVIVPLLARGRTLGAMTFVNAESSRRYGPAELALAEDLGRRAGTAVDNARLYRDARHAVRIRDEFLATLSHELRTPLNAVLGWARLLRSGRLDELMMERGLETIERNSRAQAQLIEDLLDVSRIIAGKLHLAVRPVSLVGIGQAVVESLRPAIDAKGLRVECRFGHGPGVVTGDPARLQQVIWNLVSNAIKFTNRGGRVTLSIDQRASHLELEVSDTGIGIDRGFLPYVFDRFRQADATSTRAHGGLGLGLAITRHLVEMHGGTITAESPGPDQGATFTVRLPIAAVRLTTSETTTTDGILLGLPDVDDTPRLDGLRVLVVDDDPDARELIVTVLGRRGAATRAVSSAAEALEAVSVDPPDVLVTDIGMPGEDGFSLIRKIRALPAAHGGEVPAVALTAYARPDDRTRALLAGFQLHIPKPVEPAELIAAVASLTHRP